VLSATIANPPVRVSIKEDGRTLGRSGARQSVHASTRAQVHLAGFAAEHLLTSRRPRQLDQEVGFALLARLDPALADAFPGSEDRDGHRAVEEILRMAMFNDEDDIRCEVDRFYEIARECLAAVWPSVRAAAEALLVHEELDRDGFETAIGDVDLHGTVFPLQRARGLLTSAAACSRQVAESYASRTRGRRPTSDAKPLKRGRRRRSTRRSAAIVDRA
jgi:hypothetical protein